MTYEIYRWIFVSGAITSFLMMIITILQFLHLKIPKVIFEVESEITYIHTDEWIGEEQGYDSKHFHCQNGSTHHVHRDDCSVTERI